MKSALQHFRLIEKNNGLQSTRELKKLKEFLGVSDIFVANQEGTFLRATNKPLPPDQPNLFSFCEGYRDLILGKSELAVTPLVVASPKGNGTYKFMMMPNHDRSLVLEVGMKLDFIAQILRQSASAYPELLSIALFAPSGEALGEFSQVDLNKDEFSKIPNINQTKAEIFNDYLIIWKNIDVSMEYCCECQIKGLSNESANSHYSYVLRTVISRVPIKKIIDKMKFNILFILGSIILISMFLAKYLSAWLLSNFFSFKNKVEEYLKGQIVAHDVQMKSKDEIGFISKFFSQMLEKLEENTQI